MLTSFSTTTNAIVAHTVWLQIRVPPDGWCPFVAYGIIASEMPHAFAVTILHSTSVSTA